MARITITDLPPEETIAPEELDLIFGAGPRRARLEIEQLEGRELMSATPSAIASALTHSPENYANIVGQAYHQYLGRSPDSAGLAGWVNAMQHGLSDERLELLTDHGYRPDNGWGEQWS